MSKSSGAELEFERYVAAICGLALMLALVVGAAGYAGVSRAFKGATGVASLAHVVPAASEQMRRRPMRISNRSDLRRPVTQ